MWYPHTVCGPQQASLEMRQVVVGLTLVCLAWSSAGKRPAYVDCETSEECGKGACCVIGMGRFTVPRCVAHGDLGEVCRPNGSPVNVTLEYPDPDKTTLKLTDVYYIFCPCMTGLTCQRDETTTDMPRCTDGFLENHLYYDEY